MKPAIGMQRARCACGALTVALAGPPRHIYTCSCRECRRATGSPVAHRAIFDASAVASIDGERSAWRRHGGSGRWPEQVFCPACGTVVFMRAEALADAISVSVGCLDGDTLPPPTVAHWAEGLPNWLSLHRDVRVTGR